MNDAKLNVKAGLGVRPELFEWMQVAKPNIGFVEAHSENYFSHSIAKAKLLELRESYPVSLHGVGLSLGRADALDTEHLKNIKELVDQIQPLFVSEHLAWSAYSHRHLPDLLPLPLVKESFEIICDHVSEMQDAVGRQVLIENPSNYALFDLLQTPEPEFLNNLVAKTGCGLLVDINNIEVSAHNLERNPLTYLQQLESKHIKQYHLAGYTKSGDYFIDTHNQVVSNEVWDLYRRALNLHGEKPTLIEWDSDFPEFEVLTRQCEKADEICVSASDQTYLKTSDESVKNNTGEVLSQLGLAEFQQSFLNGVLLNEAVLPLAQKGHENRIEIYQHNAFSAMTGYIEDVFPAVQGVVGGQYFSQLATQFARTMPPSDGDINLYGKKFPEFLASHENETQLPYLQDLANYEWLQHQAYFADNRSNFELASLSQSELLATPIELNPSVFLLNSDFPIYEIHRQSLPSYDGVVSIELGEAKDFLLVCKVGHIVECRRLDLGVFTLIQKMSDSENILQAIDALSGSIAEQALSAGLATMFELGLVQQRPSNK